MTDPRSTLIDGVHHVRLVESHVETSALDRRNDYVLAPMPRALVMRPTTNTEHIATSAIDLRDDVLRDEVPSIVVDVCHGVLGDERDAIVQAIEQDDTRPLRRCAAGTTPPTMADRTLVDDPLTMCLARGSSPSLEGAVAFARGSSTSLDEAAAAVRASLRLEDATDGAPTR